MGDNGKTAYTTGELAKLAGVSQARIRQLCIVGKIAATKFGRDWRISRSEAQRWLDGRDQDQDQECPG